MVICAALVETVRTAPVAQSAERSTFHTMVVGSSPTGGKMIVKCQCEEDDTVRVMIFGWAIIVCLFVSIRVSGRQKTS